MKRYLALMLVLVGMLAFAALTLWSIWFVLPALLCAALSILGVWDMIQTGTV